MALIPGNLSLLLEVIASKRSWKIGHMAFAGCQNPHGREMCLSVKLEDASPSITSKFSHHTQDNGAERCAGEERQLCQASAVLQLWIWLFFPLRFNKIYGKILMVSTCSQNLTWITAIEDSPYIWFPFQCLLHIQCSSVFYPLLQRRSTPFILIWKKPAWAWILLKRKHHLKGFPSPMRHQYLQNASTLGR